MDGLSKLPPATDQTPRIALNPEHKTLMPRPASNRAGLGHRSRHQPDETVATRPRCRLTLRQATPVMGISC